MESNEEPKFRLFGTPLEPLEEEDVSSKKRIAIEDQIVTDENGKRRFHGAFTGGFSAGFWNTVGSLEGWNPQSFKSSRSEKAEKRQRLLPTDFMDDEDLGDFGIAPQRVQAREDFAKNDKSSSRKRKLSNRDTGPIPGIPVLQQLLESSRDKVAVRLLRRMGWKPGQGIGPRQTRKEKIRSHERNNKELYVMKMYGCDIDLNKNPPECPLDDSNSSDDEELTFAPDVFEPFVCSVKDNTFGVGYSGLSRQLSGDEKGHINLFNALELLGKSNKKLSITGQAFGVGALEEEDEDIYAKDDMSKYDFSLGDRKKRYKQKLASTQDQNVVLGFVDASSDSNVLKTVHRVDLKSNFQPRNWAQRKTRFEPLSEERIIVSRESNDYKKRGLGRHDLDPNERRRRLDGETDKSVDIKNNQAEVSKKAYMPNISQKYKARDDKSKQILKLLSLDTKAFVKGGLMTNSNAEENAPSIDIEISETFKSENNKILSKAKEITKALGNLSGTFRPFASNGAKQERYEKFIEADLKEDKEIKVFLNTIQPVHLSEWDKEMERKEFVQARNMYKPLNGLMSERFVSKSLTNVLKGPSTADHDTKAIVLVERTKELWKPSTLICKRFNIPEPFGGSLAEPKVPKRNKFSVFDYIENSINFKKDFVTPVIIPKHIEKLKSFQCMKENFENVGAKSPEKDSFSVIRSMPDAVSGVAPNEYLPDFQTSRNDTSKSKTELEMRIKDSRYEHPSEKKDLFKSIFASSSDDETQNADEDAQKAESISSFVLAKSLVNPSVPVNTLRNNSPPRGIFASLFSNLAPKEEAKSPKIDDLLKFDKITFKPKHQRQDFTSEADDFYGPKVPIKLVTQNNTMSKDDSIDKTVIELLPTKTVKTTKLIEEWVEKKNKSKKSKKNKKKKDRKEKHKIKSKRAKKEKVKK